MRESDWLEIQIETLFSSDDRQRLRNLNDPDAQPAPLFFLGRSPTGNRWRLHSALPDELGAELEALLAAEPACEPDGAPPRCREAVRALLAQHRELGSEYRGPAYRFRRELAPARDVVEIDATNAERLQGEFTWLAKELPEVAPCVARVREGSAVSVCFTARRGPRAAEAGVETLADQRRKGHASAVVAAWAHSIRAEPLLPLYSTTWDNAASRGVAARLGLVPYAEDWHVSAAARDETYRSSSETRRR